MGEEIKDITTIVFRRPEPIEEPDDPDVTDVADNVNTTLEPEENKTFPPGEEFVVDYTTPLDTPINVYMVGGKARLLATSGETVTEVVSIVQGNGGSLSKVPYGAPTSMEWVGTVIDACEPVIPPPAILFDADHNKVVPNTELQVTGTIQVTYNVKKTQILVSLDPKPDVLPDGYDATALLVVRQTIPGAQGRYKQTTYHFKVGDPEE